MSAGIIMLRHDLGAPGRTGGASRLGARGYSAASRTLGKAILRLDPRLVVLVGFAAAMGWAFVGSLLLSLGAGSTSRTVAWLWLGGELLIGGTAFATLILNARPVGGDDA